MNPASLVLTPTFSKPIASVFGSDPTAIKQCDPAITSPDSSSTSTPLSERVT